MVDWRTTKDRRLKKGLCINCGKNPVCWERSKRLCVDCLERRKASDRTPKGKAEQKRKRDKARREAYEAYGGAVCRCCGEREPVFLTIDHVDDDGAQKRRDGQPSGSGLPHWLRKRGYPPGYQVLCWNCQHGKARGGCPHKTKLP